ncbi:hypothetical protein Hanom_Chr05g00440211 [Helianthus anomalus]
MPRGANEPSWARLELELGSIRALFSNLELGSFVFYQARARLVYYLLISILNKNNINNRIFRLASSISRPRARLLNKLIFRFEVGL